VLCLLLEKLLTTRIISKVPESQRNLFSRMEHEMYTEEDARNYNQAKNTKNNTVPCATCRKTIPMTVERHIGFGVYQCYECGEKENNFLKKIKA
jgi:hypothetical protein